MRWLPDFLRRRALERDLDRELQFHIDEQTTVNLAAGMSLTEAREAAVASFGGIQQTKEYCRDERIGRWLELLLEDFRFAWRGLRKAPGFTVLAALTLALGVGANSAILSALESTLLRPLPFPHADRLVRVYEGLDDADTRANTLPLCEQTLVQWQQHSAGIFEGLAAAVSGSVVVGPQNGERARSLPSARVTPNFFTVLGISPELGRSFAPGEGRPGAGRVAIVSDAFWRNSMGGRPDAIGQTITLAPRQGVVIPNGCHAPSPRATTHGDPDGGDQGDRSDRRLTAAVGFNFGFRTP